MKIRTLLLMVLLTTSIVAQENNIWYSFKENKTDLIGFKDAKQNIKIKPKFGMFTSAYKFDKIIAVSEEIAGKLELYYLTKSGKKVGIDSVHFFDNGVDCESEGFIRFRDHQIDKVGLYDGDGNAAIPPIYNDTSRVHNNLLFALRGGKRVQDGEHFFFAGAEEILIDTHNNTLIENFKYDNNLNLYSIIIEDNNHSFSPIREYFKGKNGKVYSFINYKKEFNYWFKTELNTASLTKHFFDKVSYWDNEKGWTLIPKRGIKQEFIRKVITRLERAKTKNAKYQIFLETLNPFIYESKEFDLFFNNCYESMDEKYPVMTVVIDGMRNKEEVQDHFEFLRTKEGYKLIGVSMKSE